VKGSVEYNTTLLNSMVQQIEQKALAERFRLELPLGLSIPRIFGVKCSLLSGLLLDVTDYFSSCVLWRCVFRSS